MHVTVQTSSDVAHVLHQHSPPTTESQELLNVTEELGVVLEPVHPGTQDHHLALYFTVELPQPAAAKQVIARLQRCKAIQAAYLKPLDEMPLD
jgi:hypothetical protein